MSDPRASLTLPKGLAGKLARLIRQELTRKKQRRRPRLRVIRPDSA